MTADDLRALVQRIDRSIERITSGEGTMRIPVDPTDADIVLAECRTVIESLLARAEAAEQQFQSLREATLAPVACGDGDALTDEMAAQAQTIAELREQVEWVRDVLAPRMAYDGPLFPTCCPLPEFIDELRARAEAAEEAISPTLTRAQEAEAECARLRQWLDNNTTFYDTERIEDRTVLSAVSDRIWFHATDNTKDWPFSAVIDRAIAEGKHES